MLTGLSFDAILRDIFLPLTCGGTLCIPPDDDDLAPSSVVPWLEGENVTILHTVPTIAQAWIASLPRPGSLALYARRRCEIFGGYSLAVNH